MKKQNLISHFFGRLLAGILLPLLTIATARADYQSVVLGDHPLAYYPLNSNVDPSGTTATDVSGNGNNGTYNGTDPEFNTVPGPSPFLANALLFDGFTSFVDLSTGTNTAILNFSGPITMEAWVQPATPTVGGSTPADILAKGYDGTNEMTLRANGGYYFGGTYSNTNGGKGASGGVESTNWTYLVSTYDGTNWNLYVNTELVQSSADTAGALNFTAPWAIGDGTTATAGGNSGNLRFFNGNITQVALYTNALTAAQVLNHFYFGEIGASASSSVPIIITQPQPQTVAYGSMATFSVATISALPTTNQWFKNNVAMAGQTNATLTLTNVGLGDAVNYTVVVGNANGTTNSLSVSLTLVAANSLKWDATAGSSDVWDTSTTANWLNVSNSTQTVFSPYDQVLFDDTVGVSNNVTINGTVSPSLITVNSSTNNFTFAQGTSTALSGTGSLVKKGSSTLTIYTPSGFAGSVSLQGGSIYAGNNCFKNVSAIAITNNATLDFGGGQFNNLTPITISGSGVNGQGALVNSYGDYPSELVNLIMTGDTLLGGSARWDFASGSQITGAHTMTMDWSADSQNGYYGQMNSVGIGANVTGIILTNALPASATNALGMVGMDTAFQNPGTTLTINTNCQLLFYSGGFNGSIHIRNGGLAYLWTAPAAFNGSNIILEQGAQWQSFYNSGDEPINSAVTLNGVAHVVVGDHNMIYTNVISGSGGFVFDYYNHEMVLSAANTYTGPTVIGGGGPAVALTGNGSISHSALIFFGGSNPSTTHFDVSGRSDQTLTLASGQTLAGIGGVNGSLMVVSGATISPAGTNTTIGITTGANPVGTLAAANNVTLAGTTVIKLDGSGTNDVIQAGTGISYGGTLNLVNISGAPLAAGNSFQVFSAATYSGSFATITPATPGTGLAWDLTQLSSGKVNVVSSSGGPTISSIKVSGGNVIFGGTGGVANGPYYVITSTNVSTPLTNWLILSTNAFDNNGNFNVTNVLSPNTPKQFYMLK